MKKYNFSFLRLIQFFSSISIVFFTIIFSMAIVLIWQDIPNLNKTNLYINASSSFTAIIVLIWINEYVLKDLIKIEKNLKKGG